MSAFKEAIQSGLDEYLQQLRRALTDLTPVELRWQATLNTNHIAWLVWHMARVEDSWVSLLRGSAQVWNAEGWSDRFGMDATSNGFGNTMDDIRAMPDLSLDDLMAYFDAVRAATNGYLEQANDEDLAAEYPHPRLGAVKGTWIAGHILVEESQHVGQVALIRGIMRGFGG